MQSWIGKHNGKLGFIKTPSDQIASNEYFKSDNLEIPSLKKIKSLPLPHP